jgi:hypothetical protein
MVLCLVVWLIHRKPTALGWGAAWAAGLLGAATVVIPCWWQFDYTSFGQGSTYALNGPVTIAGIRVAAILPLVLSVLVLYLAKLQYQVTWILLFVSVSFTVAVLAKKPPFLLKTASLPPRTGGGA